MGSVRQRQEICASVSLLPGHGVTSDVDNRVERTKAADTSLVHGGGGGGVQNLLTMLHTGWRTIEQKLGSLVRCDGLIDSPSSSSSVDDTFVHCFDGIHQTNKTRRCTLEIGSSVDSIYKNNNIPLLHAPSSLVIIALGAVQTCLFECFLRSIVDLDPTRAFG